MSIWIVVTVRDLNIYLVLWPFVLMVPLAANKWYPLDVRQFLFLATRNRDFCFYVCLSWLHIDDKFYIHGCRVLQMSELIVVFRQWFIKVVNCLFLHFYGRGILTEFSTETANPCSTAGYWSNTRSPDSYVMVLPLKFQLIYYFLAVKP